MVWEPRSSSGRSILKRFAAGLWLFVGVALACYGRALPAAGAEATEPWDQLTIPFFRHLTIPKDLPNAVSMITQDRNGLIWIGTQDGLARWDGYRARLFRHDPQDPRSLPANLVNAVAVDDQGTLFVATGEGIVARYDPRSETFLSMPATSTGTGFYTAFLAEGQGELWLGNANGLSHFTPATNAWESVELPGRTRVWSLLKTRNGSLWAGTDHGLFVRRLAGGAFIQVGGEIGASPFLQANIRSLRETADGSLWLGTHDGKLGLITPDGRIVAAQIPSPSGAVLSMVEIHPGLLCAATAGSGLAFIDGTTGKLLRAIKYDAQRPSGLSDDFIYNLFKDQSGGLWISHFKGADYIPSFDETFQSLLPSNRLSSALSGSHITTQSPQPDGEILIGTESGIDVLANTDGRYTIHHLAEKGTPLPQALIYDIATTEDGTTWIATGQGLYRRRGDVIRHVDIVGTDPIRTVLPESGVLWLGTERRGLLRLDLATNRLAAYQHEAADPDSISDNFVLAIKRAAGLGLWVGTQHGLNLFDGQRFRTYFHAENDPDSLPSDTAVTLQFDPQKRLWVGTHGGGIAILEGNPLGSHRFLHLRQSDGLPNENIATLLVDKAGGMWASSDAGFAKINPETLNVSSFTVADGLAITGYFANSGARLPDGTLLFGGVGGITVVHPDHFVEWTYSPQVVPVSVRVGQRLLPVASPVVLSPQDHSLQVEFSALDYSAPDRNKYAYKLEGFDRDWIEADSDHRLAAYTNLPPGSYTLVLRGSNRAGIWTEPSTRISVSVLPAWYQTLWFKIMLGMAGILAVTALIRSRTAYLRRRQKELERQVAERTAEIASLLHNSGEGFLSFGPDLIVDRQFSRACETFLGESPAGKHAAWLMFAENPKQAAFLTDSVPAALASQDTQKRELILSLLPKDIDRRGRQLKAHYAMLENGHLMVVLRDVSTERRLAQRVASEHRRLGLIVAAVTDSRDFFDAVNSFRNFLALDWRSFLASHAPPAAALQEVYRQIHTFKGELNQFSLEKTPALLHEMEERLDELRVSPEAISLDRIETALLSVNLSDALDQDLAVIRKALGDDFLEKGGQVTMTPAQAAQIKSLVKRWRRGEEIDLGHPTIRQLLDEIDQIGTVSLHEELLSYDKTLAQVALRMEKEVAPLVVKGGEDIWIDPDIFGRFLRSLIHVFRNCVTHGIEKPDQRLEKGKNELGLISCTAQRNGETISLVISDDGAGLDLAALRLRLITCGLCSEEEAASMTDDEIADFIFRDHVSTSDKVDQWTGRGVGLAAVRQEVERLGGTVAVESFEDRGTRFRFTLKLRPYAANQAA
jgi:ligand-binding sensor domain-containing protein/signal transduction histidine kinase